MHTAPKGKKKPRKKPKIKQYYCQLVCLMLRQRYTATGFRRKCVGEDKRPATNKRRRQEPTPDLVGLASPRSLRIELHLRQRCLGADHEATQAIERQLQAQEAGLEAEHCSRLSQGHQEEDDEEKADRLFPKTYARRSGQRETSRGSTGAAGVLGEIDESSVAGGAPVDEVPTADRPVEQTKPRRFEQIRPSWDRVKSTLNRLQNTETTVHKEGKNGGAKGVSREDGRSPGGAERTLAALARSFQELDQEELLLTTENPSQGRDRSAAAAAAVSSSSDFPVHSPCLTQRTLRAADKDDPELKQAFRDYRDALSGISSPMPFDDFVRNRGVFVHQGEGGLWDGMLDE